MITISDNELKLLLKYGNHYYRMIKHLRVVLTYLHDLNETKESFDMYKKLRYTIGGNICELKEILTTLSLAELVNKAYIQYVLDGKLTIDQAIELSCNITGIVD